MRKVMTTVMAGLVAVTSLVSVAVPAAEAQPRHWRPHPYDGPRHDRHGYHGPRRHHRSGVGAAVAGGIIGLAAGSIIAGSVARSGDGVAYCEQRYRSYDRSSGTYLGYDGLRHACP